MKRILLTGLAIVLVLLASITIAAAIFYAWTDWAGARHWQAVEAKLRAKGEPVTIADIAPKPIPDEINFAAAPIFAEIATEPDPAKRRITQILGLSWKGSKTFSPLVNAARSIDPRFKGSDIDAARVILAQTAKWKPILDEIREAAQRPETDWKVNYGALFKMPVGHLSVLLKVVQVLAIDAEVHLELGDSGMALEDFKLILNLSGRAEAPPLLISLLVRQAMVQMDMKLATYGLKRHVWKPTELEEIQHAFGDVPARAELCGALTVERVFFEETVSGIFKKTIRSNGDASPSLKSSTSEPSLIGQIGKMAWVFRPAGWCSEDQCAYSNLIEKLKDSLAIPGRYVLPISEGAVRFDLRTPLTRDTLHTIVLSVERTLYLQTSLDEARTACAIECYRLAHGTLPPDLNALCPEFLTAVPLDPMSGQPLHYRPAQGDSYILYGVGWNQKDDGGSELNLEHQKVPSHPPDTLDWVWKIGNPS